MPFDWLSRIGGARKLAELLRNPWGPPANPQPERANPSPNGAEIGGGHLVVARGQSAMSDSRKPSDMPRADIPQEDAASLSSAERIAALVADVLAEMAARDGIPRSRAAAVMLVAISGQEAAWIHRDQVVTGKALGQIGPATGLWQFERGGGVRGVLEHPASAAVARRWCAQAGIKGLTPSPDAVWRRLVEDDRLACAFARLLLRTDPRTLPTDVQAGFDYYLRNWRPGAWTNGTAAQREALRRKWGDRWAAAERVVPR